MASLGSLVIELAASTARLQSDLGKAVGMAQSAAARFSRAFSGVATLAGAGSLGAVVARSIEMGDELNKAAIKAGTTGKAMSELAYAAKQSDIDLSSLSTAIKKMQVSLSEAAAGGKSQIKTLNDLGVSIQQIRALKADQQFELIADRISEIRDPADRARFATELFGKAGADLLPMFEQGAAGIRKAREEAQKLGVSFSDEQLKRLSAADDAAKRMKASWEGFAAALTEKAAPAISFTLGLLHGELPQAEIGSQIANITYQIQALEGTKTERGLKKLAELRAQLKSLGEQSRAAASRTGTRFGAGPGTPEAPTVEPDKGLLAAAARAQAAYYEGLRRSAQVASSAFDDLLRKRAEEMQLQREIVQGLGDETDALRTLSQIAEEGAEGAARALTETARGMTVFAEQASRNMQDAMAKFLFDPFKDGLKGMLRSFVDTIRQMVAQAAAAKIFGMLGGLGKSGGNSFLSTLGSFFGGFKAQGGPLEQGKWYIAGEKGPEPIWGGGAGAFASGYGGGGGGATVNVSYNVDARGATADLAKALPGILKAHGESVKSDIIDGIRRRKYAV